jgi:hypothetical protein
MAGWANLAVPDRRIYTESWVLTMGKSRGTADRPTAIIGVSLLNPEGASPCFVRDLLAGGRDLLNHPRASDVTGLPVRFLDDLNLHFCPFNSRTRCTRFQHYLPGAAICSITQVHPTSLGFRSAFLTI